MTEHTYSTHLVWSGSTGAGYRAYPRRHSAAAPPAAPIAISADPHFRGDADLVNPEQLLVMAASSCQLLSFLAVAARAGVDVLDYEDDARGLMTERTAPMRLERIDLAPVVRVAPGSDHQQVLALVEQAHAECYVAASLTSTVRVHPTVVEA